MSTLDRLELTRRLIGEHSVSSAPSRPIADFVSNVLADAGFRIERHTYHTKGNIEKVNVIAVKGGDGTPELAFSGHLDTVPYEDSGWKSDPLKLTERDGKFFGRGACDMKGFLGLAMEVGMRIPAVDLKKPFGLIFTSDEEVGCVGARRLVENRPALAKNVVIGEPTGLRPLILHKGYIFLQVWLRGTDGHSSEPHKGRNAIQRAVPTVVGRLNEMASSLEQIRDPRFAVPFPTLNVGVIRSGDGAAKNVIAKEVLIELDIRPLPGQDVNEIIEAVRRHVAHDGDVNGIEVEVRLARAPTPTFPASRATRRRLSGLRAPGRRWRYRRLTGADFLPLNRRGKR